MFGPPRSRNDQTVFNQSTLFNYTLIFHWPPVRPFSNSLGYVLNRFSSLTDVIYPWMTIFPLPHPSPISRKDLICSRLQQQQLQQSNTSCHGNKNLTPTCLSSCTIATTSRRCCIIIKTVCPKWPTICSILYISSMN